MTLKSHKDLIVWQKSIILVKEVYILTGFLPHDEIYGLVSQMRRAAIFIPSNIAEGYARKNLKEYLQFLRVSYGSGAELETQLMLSKDLHKNINHATAELLCEEVLKMLNVMIDKLEGGSQ